MPLRIQTLWREPLLHFVLIGAALFLYYDFVGRGDSEAPAAKRIIVSSPRNALLSAAVKWNSSWPTSSVPGRARRH
jgi:hypothetical protein